MTIETEAVTLLRLHTCWLSILCLTWPSAFIWSLYFSKRMKANLLDDPVVLKRFPRQCRCEIAQQSTHLSRFSSAMTRGPYFDSKYLRKSASVVLGDKFKMMRSTVFG